MNKKVSFSEKRFVNVSVCQSNIKSKKGTYYGKVCKTGHLSTKQILLLAKDRSPYIDIPMVESALQTIADVILDMAGQGYNVEFANLGTFSLSTQGKIEMRDEDLPYQHKVSASSFKQAKSYDTPANLAKSWQEVSEEDETIERIEVDGNYDVSEKVKSEVHFAFKFSASKALKASMKNIKMNLAIKKKTAPIIDKVENALPERKEASPQIIKVKGNNLKIAGDDERVGIYIEEKVDKENTPPFMMSDQRKIEVSSLIQNENKTLTFVLDRRLKRGVQYCITIITQSTLGGKLGKKLRKGEMTFLL